MKVTLAQIYESFRTIEKNGSYNYLEYLKLQKKEGYLFYIEEVEVMKSKKPFELYYYLTSNRKSAINAFPVSINDFQFYKNWKEQLMFLQEYFQNYYMLETVSLEYLSGYNLKRPYVGRKYLWFYKPY